MILRFLFFLLVCYLLYKFIFDFLLPVYKSTKKVKQGFREMQERMQQGQHNGSNYQQASQGHPTSKGDYIDFEEVKD